MNLSVDPIFCLPDRFVVPPVNPVGSSDLFPGPGAGMYPTRYFTIQNDFFFLLIAVYCNGKYKVYEVVFFLVGFQG